MANLACFRNVGSDLEPIGCKAVIFALFSPKIGMGGVSSFVTVLIPPPSSETWHLTFLQRGHRKLFWGGR